VDRELCEPSRRGVHGLSGASHLRDLAKAAGKVISDGGLLCLLAAFIPYTWGTVVLSGNTVPDQSGPWLATMFMSLLYGGLACAGFSAVALLPIRHRSAHAPAG
jgi:hypothetical protein